MLTYILYQVVLDPESLDHKYKNNVEKHGTY